MIGVVLDDLWGFEVIERRQGESTLAWIQRMVGGYIEAIQWLDGYDAFINEEGKLEGLPINELGTALWYEALGFEADDVLCGPVAVVGPPTRSGNTTSLTPLKVGELAVKVARTKELLRRPT